MNINLKVMTALSELKVPVAFQVYNGQAKQYITFFCYLETGEFFADDIQKGTGYYIQVDIWSLGNYGEIAEKVRAAMQEAGFSFLGAFDLYEEESRFYHKVIRFYYMEV